MEGKKLGWILAIIILLLVVASGFFLWMTGITANDFLTINLFPLLAKGATLNFVLFLVLSSAALAVILFVAKRFEFKKALLFSEVGYLAGGLIAVGAFGLVDFLVPLLFGALGIFFAAKNLAKKEAELKYSAELRAGCWSAGKITALFAAGFFIYLLIISAGQTQTLSEGFSEGLFALTIGSGTSIGTPLTDAIAALQQASYLSVKNLPEYKAVMQQGTREGAELDLKISALMTAVGSKEYKDTIAGETGKLFNNLPVVKTVAQYAWIIYAIFALIALSLVGNIIIKNLAGIIYWILRAMGKQKKAEEAAQIEKKTW